MTFEVGKTYRTKGGWLAKVIGTFMNEALLVEHHRVMRMISTGETDWSWAEPRKNYTLTTEEVK